MKNHVKYSPQDTINNHRVYSEYLQLGIEDGWSAGDKEENFRILLDIFRLTNTPMHQATVLDVGCGTGDLAQFLSDKNIKNYVGIDIFEPAIEKAREKFPHHTFILGDFLSYPFKQKFDFVFCSGALTTILDTDNYEILKIWIPKMWRLAKRGVVFNFLLENNETNNELFLYDHDRVIEICKKEIPQAQITTITTDAGSANTLQEMHVFLY